MNEDYEKKLRLLISHEDTVLNWSTMALTSIEKICEIDLSVDEKGNPDAEMIEIKII